LLQISGKRFLIDPVFYEPAPVSFVFSAFRSTDKFLPSDMPDIDYLVITHDHWDHLDYKTVTELKDRIGNVICPLGVGEHFEYWGFSNEDIIELDWNENRQLEDNIIVHCLPSCHFSGRLFRNPTLWASYLIESSHKIYIAGDGGYDSRFQEIGDEFDGVDEYGISEELEEDDKN